MAAPFACDVAALRITVAALMTTTWIARHLTVGEGTDLVLIPGLCEGDPAVIQDKVGVPVAKGPTDLREIPRYFGRSAATHDYGAWDIEILAEINNAPRLSREADPQRSRALTAHPAPTSSTSAARPVSRFPGLADVVRELVDAGMRVSIDTFDVDEIRTAVRAGASFVLSVNQSNVEIARELSSSPVRWVAVPELGGPIETLEPTIDEARCVGRVVSHRSDPRTDRHGFHGVTRALRERPPPLA